ncbi:unnamed protein product [Rotaria sp. Silwood1]|nr:unnamed protein product [Rotaria sp. Silwood1]CAF3678691.1 unnamed protein product [Rotaria sp. Silwood1]CAF3707751.1 unnamed protein product [Rotaria sp. Silwood1]CAF4957642.1 unnamed protein product [Rotaria sp. Silwood1]
MWIVNSMIVIAIALFMQLHNAYAQCSPQAAQNCVPYTCVQTENIFSCLCPNMQLASSAAECDIINPPTTQPPVVIPNQCSTAVCPAGSTCVPTNQNPALYVCVCPNNIIANPNCPGVLPNNQCLFNNPCRNGGTCVINPLTQQPVCICPPNTYGQNCANPCRPYCDNSWCYNGGRCANAYGQAYCMCPYNYRGRRCELRYSAYNYVYLYHYPHYHIGK